VETWVVDNASTDGSPEVVRPPARLIASGVNLGFGPAVNRVAEQAGDWDWLVVANADTAPEPGALDALLAAGGADPRAGALAPRLIRPDGTTQHSAYPFWSPAFALRFNAGRYSRRWAEAQCLEGAWDPDRPRRVPWAVGAFLLVRRQAWDEAGGFDPAQWLYAEDLDLGWRLAAAGWATRYVPEARVRHEESASTAPLWGEERVDRWMAATYEWLHRRRGRARAGAVAALNVTGALARSALARDPWRRRVERRWARLHAAGLTPGAARRGAARPPACPPSC
jgi:GT2 family glycosyltransferase